MSNGAPRYGPYDQPPYGYQSPYPPMRTGTNTLAILALVFAFLCAPAAIVMGAIARKQIRRSGEEGMGLATAGLVLGIVFTVLSVIWIVAALVLFAAVAQHIDYPNTNGALAYFGF